MNDQHSVGKVCFVFVVAAYVVAVFVAKPALWCAEVQNRIVGFAADLPYGCFDYRYTAGATVVIYTLFVAVTVVSWGFERDKTVRVGDDN